MTATRELRFSILLAKLGHFNPFLKKKSKKSQHINHIQIFGEKHQNLEFSSFSVQSCPRTDTVKLWPNDNLCQSVSFFVQSCPRIASILNRQQSPISGENTTDWKFLSFTAQSWPRIDRIENRQQNSVPGEIMIKWLSPPICVQSC